MSDDKYDVLVTSLTPAWQQVFDVAELSLGNVNRFQHSWEFPGGKVANVAVILAALGRPSLTLAPIGGDAGSRFADGYRRWALRGEWLNVASPTRVCTTLLGGTRNPTTELVQERRRSPSTSCNNSLTATEA